MRCPNCEIRHDRQCSYAYRTQEFYEAIIDALRFVAYRCGYALGVHGSLKTDIDLIAAPWRASPVDAAYLAEQVRLTAERIVGTARVREGDPSPAQKPGGRLAWTFYLQPHGVEGPYIDLSVMPIQIPNV